MLNLLYKKVLNNAFIPLFLAGFILYASSHMHFSVMLGAYKASFSCANIAWPLVAFFFPSKMLLGLLSGLAGLKALGVSGLPLMSLTHGVPTLASILTIKAAFWRRGDATMRLFVPLLCMALFILHPVGGRACLYSFYWFIPACLWLSGWQTVITRALSAIFVAHAVGSVMWLYALETTPLFWLALIPVVAAERLTIVALISVGYYAITYFREKKGHISTALFSIFSNRNFD